MNPRSGAWPRPSTSSTPTARARMRRPWRPGSPPSGPWCGRSTRSWPGSRPSTRTLPANVRHKRRLRPRPGPHPRLASAPGIPVHRANWNAMKPGSKAFWRSESPVSWRRASAERRRAGVWQASGGLPCCTHASGAGVTPAPLDGLRPGDGLAGRDLDVDGGADLGVQPDAHLVRAHGLDRVAELDPAPVELGAARLAHGRGDVRRADRAEQATAAARPPPHPHVQALELGRHGLGVLNAADLPGRPGPLDQLDLLLGAAGPGYRETPRDQVVAAVAGRDVHHITGGAETAHFLGEDELHRCTTHLPYSLARRARVRKQRHLAGVLDRRRDVPLVAGAVTGHPAGADLAAVRDVLAQQAGVLVVDVRGPVVAERADLLLRLAQWWLGHRGALLRAPPAAGMLGCLYLWLVSG